MAAPFFARWLEPEQASRAVEWAGRIVLAYLYDGESGTDLVDSDDTRALVRAFVLPGILALRMESEDSSPSPTRRSTHHPTTKGAVQ